MIERLVAIKGGGALRGRTVERLSDCVVYIFELDVRESVRVCITVPSAEYKGFTLIRPIIVLLFNLERSRCSHSGASEHLERTPVVAVAVTVAVTVGGDSDSGSGMW